jgi:hypothetical protein
MMHSTVVYIYLLFENTYPITTLQRTESILCIGVIYFCLQIILKGLVLQTKFTCYIYNYCKILRNFLRIIIFMNLEFSIKLTSLDGITSEKQVQSQVHEENAKFCQIMINCYTNGIQTKLSVYVFNI